MGEAFYIALLCAKFFGGEAEVTYPFGGGYNRIDCVTADWAIEFGLDKTSSRDSIVQAVVAAKVLGKAAYVLIVDTDGVMGKLEQEISYTCSLTRGVTCTVVKISDDCRVEFLPGIRTP